MKIIGIQNFTEYPISTDVLVADPPWNYQSKHPFITYNQVTYERWDDQKGLEFIFSQDVHYIFLWVTNSKLIDVFKADHRKFEYKQIFTWIKTTSKNNPVFGLGNNFRNCTEQLLLFVRKGDKPLRFNERNIYTGQSKARTEKPKEFEKHLFQLLSDRDKTITYLFSGPNTEVFKDFDNLTLIDRCFLK